MRFWLLFFSGLLGSALYSQTTPTFFQPVPEESILLPEKAERKLIPAQYNTYRLDYPGIKAALQQAPPEFSEAARQQACTLSLPMADGSLETFSVWEVPTAEPALAALMPFARSFAGESLRDKRKTVRLTYTLRGFRATILRPDLGAEFIEPYAWGQDEFYLVYDLKNTPPGDWNTAPGTFRVLPAAPQETPAPFAPAVEARGTQVDPVKLKTYKLVVSTTGEFGQDHGGTPQSVYSAVFEYVNKVNAAYERDMSIRFTLIQGSLLVMFSNPATDPFTGFDNGTLAGQNEQALQGAGIPAVAYDIGHVLTRGGGGIGGLGVVCLGGKSFGCTAGSGAYGNGFIGVLCQELGHQLAGNHTWNRCGGGVQDQRSNSTAYEPGSGTTIMSYAGGCGPDNIGDPRQLYFHSGSIEEIRRYVLYEAGSQCGTETVTNNHPPTVSLAYQDNFFIPIGTPFELKGSAEDIDGDSLSYAWEEIDLGPEIPLGEQEANSPLFRCWNPAQATNRYFPRLTTIRNNAYDITELLPTYTRDLTFRFVVRDHRYGFAWDDVAFKSWGQAGPFLVLSPNSSASSWKIGEYTEVRWDVANTDKAPVNCTHVNIRLSTDGGLTYPITLAGRVKNDGSHYVLVPDLPTGSARVRVDADANVFFDISNQNFSIQQPTQPSFTLGLNNDSGVLCLPAEHTVEIATAGVQGFSQPVSLAIAGNLPPNVSASFSATTIQPGGSATLTFDFSQVTEENEFTIVVQATPAGGAPIQREVVLRTVRNDFSALTLTLPPNGATELRLTQTLHWTKAADAEAYDLQFASAPSFAPATLLASVSNTTLDSFKVPVFLAKGTPYFWRVRPKNECGEAPWTEPFFFSTFAEKCAVWEAYDLPKTMTANGTPTIESKINVTEGGPIKNMEVRQIKGYHEFFKDLDVHLISPQGVDLTLWTKKCGNFNGFFNFRLTDEAPSPMPCPPPNNGNAYRPQNPLSAFTNQSSEGVWTLRVRDTEFSGGGSLEAFQLTFCSEVTLSPPYLVNNNPLYLDPGNNKGITPGLLLVEDANNTHSQLLYTLLTVPQHGHLALNWGAPLQAGAQFTQADLDNGALRFFDYGANYVSDGFRFMVTDGEGGFFGTPKFIIQPAPVVGAHTPEAGVFGFRLFPNPADDAVWVALDRTAPDQLPVTVYNAAGQQIQIAVFPAGAERLLLHTAGLPRGLYVVQVGAAVRKLALR
ncbi:MAG: proprotein convertase P-domain-containing protein [Saprospirales bacterium]|nr:proprotein convertase P-domain-containing protein [Saprospirales bacterium]